MRTRPGVWSTRAPSAYRSSAWASATLAGLVALACTRSPTSIPPVRATAVAPGPRPTASVAAPLEPSAAIVPPRPAPVDCSGWEAHQRFPVADDLRAGWVAGDGQAVFVGDSGTIVHFDGQRWFTRPAPSAPFLTDVWGSAADDVYAVGYGGTVLHFDGRRWSPVALSLPASPHLYAVWGSAADDVFVAGSQGVIVHYDGTTWTSMPSGAGASLHDVWGSSSSDVFAVGADGLILHHDGARWSQMSAGTTDSLREVTGTAPDDVYAMSETRLLHFDGKRWKTVRRPHVEDVFLAMHSPSRGEQLISFTSAVSGSNERKRGAVLRFDGKSWSQLPPHEGPFTAFVPIPDGGNYAIGRHGAIHRLRGAAIELLTPPLIANLVRVVRGPDDGLVGLRHNGEIVHRRDGVWGDLTRAPVAAAYDLAVDDGGALWVAGADRDAGHRRPVIAYFDGKRWTKAWSGRAGDGAALLAFGGSTGGRFAVGTQGLIMRHDGARWAAMDAPMKGRLTAVWAAASDDVVAVGAAPNGRDGTILHYDGTAWSIVPGVKAPPLAGVWGPAADDIFAVGGALAPDFLDSGASSAAILHYDGERWSTMRADDDANNELFVAVWGNSARDVFALRSIELADGGEDYSSWTLFHYDGAAWAPLVKGLEAFVAGTSTPERTDLVGRPRPGELACARPGV